jgi:hypothetical protein
MALAAIPNSILHKIGSLMFKFLWSGIEGRNHIHLCSWSHLSRTKHLGGWGIQNIHLFNRALAANSLWLVLTKEEIWIKVVKDKYIPNCSTITWFQEDSSHNLSASQTVKILIKALHLLTHWLGWRTGFGHCVQVHLDHILGVGNLSFLSSHLRSELRRILVLYLFEVIGLDKVRINTSYWK